MGPEESCVRLMGTIPRRDTSAIVGFMPTTPFTDEGPIMEPAVSVPIVAEAKLIAVEIPDPLLDPAALRVTS
jgi:hypothetical protein